MNEQGQSYGAVAATQEFSWVTIALILIAIGIVGALLALWWGKKLAKAHRRAREELEARGELAPESLAKGGRAEQPSPAPATPPAPTPTEPTPPPIENEPIAAAGAFGASPASLAADTGAASATPAPEPSDDRDDLTRLKGVGPKLAARLNELGIRRFADLAALDDASAQALDAQLGSFQGRMTRDRWVEQARFLADGDRAGYEAVFGKL